MTLRPLLKFPDPALRRPADPVETFGPALRALAADLLDTLRAAPGVGITAPHIGVSLRLVVLELTPGDVHIYANPRIVWASDDTIRHEEGSISMPGVLEEIERRARVRVAYQDLDGVAHEEEAADFRAVCHQHEIDQLDGIFWIQRLSRLKRERVIKRYEKLRAS